LALVDANYKFTKNWQWWIRQIQWWEDFLQDWFWENHRKPICLIFPILTTA
jgi:hypothetical protein